MTGGETIFLELLAALSVGIGLGWWIRHDQAHAEREVEALVRRSAEILRRSAPLPPGVASLEAYRRRRADRDSA